MDPGMFCRDLIDDKDTIYEKWSSNGLNAFAKL